MVKADAFGRDGIAKFHCISLTHEFAAGSFLHLFCMPPLHFSIFYNCSGDF